MDTDLNVKKDDKSATAEGSLAVSLSAACDMCPTTLRAHKSGAVRSDVRWNMGVGVFLPLMEDKEVCLSAYLPRATP